MNLKTAKKIRQGIRRDNKHQVGEFSEFFALKLNSLPLGKRMRFAWSVVRGRVD